MPDKRLGTCIYSLCFVSDLRQVNAHRAGLEYVWRLTCVQLNFDFRTGYVTSAANSLVCCHSAAGQMDLFMQDQEKAILDDNEVSEDADPVAIGGEYCRHVDDSVCVCLQATLVLQWHVLPFV